MHTKNAAQCTQIRAENHENGWKLSERNATFVVKEGTSSFSGVFSSFLMHGTFMEVPGTIKASRFPSFRASRQISLWKIVNVSNRCSTIGLLRNLREILAFARVVSLVCRARHLWRVPLTHFEFIFPRPRDIPRDRISRFSQLLEHGFSIQISYSNSIRNANLRHQILFKWSRHVVD